MHGVLNVLHLVQEVFMNAVGYARSVDESIAVEQRYLFQGHEAELQDPVWSLAACADADPEIFFPMSAQDSLGRAEALSYCRSCAIVNDCLNLALRDRSIVGIWGGTDEAERARLRLPTPR